MNRKLKKQEKWNELNEEQQKEVELELLKEFEEMGDKMQRDLQEFYDSGYIFPLNINVEDLTLEKKWDTAMKIMGKNEVKLEKGAKFRHYDPRKNKYTEKVSYNIQGRFQGKNRKKLDAVIEEKFTDEDNKNAITKQTIIEYKQQKGEPIEKQITQNINIRKISTTQKELLGDFYESSEEAMGSEEKLQDEITKKIGEKMLTKKTSLFDYLEKKEKEKKVKLPLKRKSKKPKKGKMLIEVIEEKEEEEERGKETQKKELEKKEKEEKEKEMLIALYKSPERQQHDVLCKFYLQGKKCQVGKDCQYLHNIRALKDISCLNKKCAKVEFVSDGVYKNFSDNVREICPYRHFKETEASYEKRIEPLKNDIYKKREENKKKKKEKNQKINSSKKNRLSKRSSKNMRGKKGEKKKVKSPVKVKTPAPVKVKSPTPKKKSPVKLKSPTPVKLKTPTPVKLKSPTPKKKSPVKLKSPTPKKKSPVKVKTPTAVKVKSPTPKKKSPSAFRRTFDKQIFTDGKMCKIKKKNL